MKVLIIEDHQDWPATSTTLRKKDISGTLLYPEAGPEKLGLFQYDCILLDIGLPTATA